MPEKHKKKRRVFLGPIKLETIPFTSNDIRKIRTLLLMGLQINILKKRDGLYKGWIKHFKHIKVVDSKPISVYRRLFKILKKKYDIYLA